MRSAPSWNERAAASPRSTCHFGSSAGPPNSSLKFVGQFSATAIVKLTDLIASRLPVRSVERNSIR